MTQEFTYEDCPACAAAAGRAPAQIVTENPAFLAFLDPDPIRRGHLQVVQRAHFSSFNALPDALARDLLTLAERLAQAQRSVFQVDRVGFLFPAESGSYGAVHLVPLLSAGDVIGRRSAGRAGDALRSDSEPVDLELARNARRLRHCLLSAESRDALP